MSRSIFPAKSISLYQISTYVFNYQSTRSTLEETQIDALVEVSNLTIKSLLTQNFGQAIDNFKINGTPMVEIIKWCKSAQEVTINLLGLEHSGIEPLFQHTNSIISPNICQSTWQRTTALC